jgi:Asp-tRNA(Asn)/Glu-tRNA(Gln) amidotransferase A subunit family amidase
MARSLQHEYRKHRERLSPALLSRIQRGLDCRPVEYESALKLADECRDTIDALLSSVDLVITPSAAGEAPAGLASTGSSTFNRTWTLLGVPCLTLPVARGTQNLPIGIQLIGRLRRDAQLLCAGLWIEGALPQLADCKEIS